LEDQKVVNLRPTTTRRKRGKRAINARKDAPGAEYDWSPGLKKWIKVTTIPTDTPASRRYQRTTGDGAWAKIPLREGIEAAVKMQTPELAVLLIVREQIYLRKTNPVRISNEICETYGVSRHVRLRGLRKLAEAGVILVEQSGREAPLVTWLWPL
jgi:hypothetical protein